MSEDLNTLSNMLKLSIETWDPNEVVAEDALAKTARYYGLMDYTPEMIRTSDGVTDDQIYMIYYAYKIDIDEGPINLS